MDKYFSKYKPRFRATLIMSQPTKAAEIVAAEYFGEQQVVAEMQGEGDGVATGAGELSGIGAIDGLAQGVASGVGQLSGDGDISGLVSAQASGSATAAGSGNIQGSGQGVGAGSGTLSVQPAAASWTAKPGVAVSSAVNGYWEFLPQGWNTGPKPALIVFHGSGEQGNGTTQLNNILTQGLPKLINDRWGTGNSFPHDMIVICVQYVGSPPGLYAVNDTINWVIANYDVDPDSVHVTGYSLGAAGVLGWTDLGDLSHVASLSSVATSQSYFANGGNNIVNSNLATIFIHGANDVFPTSYSFSVGWRDSINALSPAIPAVLVTVPGQGHNIDEIVYDWLSFEVATGMDVFEWHLDNSRLPDEYIRGTAAGSASGSGAMAGDGAMQGGGQGSASGSGIMDQPMAGGADGQASGSGQISGIGDIQGDADGQAVGQAVINADGVLQGVGSGQGDGNAQVSGTGDMQGEGQGNADGFGDMEGGMMRGQGDGQASGQGQIEGLGNVYGHGDGDSSGTGQLDGNTDVQGIGGGIASGSAQIEATGQMAGQGDGISSGGGTLGQSEPMEMIEIIADGRIEQSIAVDAIIAGSLTDVSPIAQLPGYKSTIEQIIQL